MNYWRLTPLFHYRFSNPTYPPQALGQLVSLVQYGCSALAKSEPVGIPILRMNNLQSEGLDLSDLKYIELDKHTLESHRLISGDLLFNRTNSKELVGKCEVFEEQGDWVFASYLIRVRTQENLLIPRFVSDFLSTNAGRLQIDRLSRQIIGMTNINAEELRQILLPLPLLGKQAEFVREMDAARAARKAKLAEIETLLSSIDGYVLETLGLSKSPPQRRVFAINAGATKNGRADPDFHSLRFQTIRRGIENGIYPAQTVAELCGFIAAGFAAGKQDQVFDYDVGVPHLRPLNLNIHGEISLDSTKFVPKTVVEKADYCQIGEVLFNNTNSTEMVGKSAVFNLEQPCACSNHMTRLRPKAGVNPEYLAAVFNALRSLGYLGLLSTNFNNQAGINTTTLNTLKLPCPPPSVQDAIAAEIRRRREQARRLRLEAETEWAEAKARFEAALLGEPNDLDNDLITFAISPDHDEKDELSINQNPRRGAL